MKRAPAPVPFILKETTRSTTKSIQIQQKMKTNSYQAKILPKSRTHTAKSETTLQNTRERESDTAHYSEEVHSASFYSTTWMDRLSSG
jgi:hypothetical protein